MNFLQKRCWAEIDLAALGHNVAAIRGRLGSHAGIMAVVKANAYGHGAVPIVRALEPLVAAFGVANVTEAVQILEGMEAGEGGNDGHPIDPARIHILGTALPEERAEIARRGFMPVISSFEEAMAYERLAADREKPLPVNVAIDTGMGRIGILGKDALAEVREIALLPRIEIRALATHLPSADEDEHFTEAQLGKFDALLSDLRAAGISAPVVHVLNSAGAILFPGHARDLARIGLALYGSSPVPAFQYQLRPVLAWKTAVTLVRDIPVGHGISYGRTFQTTRPTRVATLGVGYADGLPRSLSGQGAEVLIAGHRCPLLGRVTMDQIMVDITQLEGKTGGDIVAGTEAVLLGRQEANGITEEITAAELARQAGTIAWEIFTGLSPRVERIYLHTGGTSAKAGHA